MCKTLYEDSHLKILAVKVWAGFNTHYRTLQVPSNLHMITSNLHIITQTMYVIVACTCFLHNLSQPIFQFGPNCRPITGNCFCFPCSVYACSPTINSRQWLKIMIDSSWAMMQQELMSTWPWWTRSSLCFWCSNLRQIYTFLLDFVSPKQQSKGPASFSFFSSCHAVRLQTVPHGWNRAMTCSYV